MPGRSRKFGNYLLELRQAKGWTLRDVARVSRLSLTHVWNLEQNNNAPTLTALYQLSRAFRLPLSRFVAPLQR